MACYRIVLWMSLVLIYSIDSSSMLLVRAATEKVKPLAHQTYRLRHRDLPVPLPQVEVGFVQPSKRSRYFNQLKKRDGVSRLEKAIRINNIEQIRSLRKYKGYWGRTGSTASFQAIKHLEGPRLKRVLKLLEAPYTNWKMPHLATLQDPATVFEYMDGIYHLPVNMDNTADLNKYYLLQFNPIVYAIDLFFRKSEKEQIAAYKEYFNYLKDKYQASSLTCEDQGECKKPAREDLARTLHNHIAAATAVMVALVSKTPPEVDENTSKILGLSDPLSPYAGVVESLKAFAIDCDDVDPIEAVKAAAPLNSRKLIKRVARVVSALMLDEDIRLFGHHPARARAFLTESFSFAPMGKLPYPRQHEIAWKHILRTIKKVERRQHKR